MNWKSFITSWLLWFVVYLSTLIATTFEEKIWLFVLIVVLGFIIYRILLEIWYDLKQ
jgi:hypothetical protein